MRISMLGFNGEHLTWQYVALVALNVLQTLYLAYLAADRQRHKRNGD